MNVECLLIGDIGGTNASFALVNDFEAIAYSVPWLQQSDIVSVGLPEPKNLKDTDFAFGVLGPGTGLGAAGLFKKRRPDFSDRRRSGAPWFRSRNSSTG